MANATAADSTAAASLAATAVDAAAIDSINVATSTRSELKDKPGAAANCPPSSSLPTPGPAPPTGRRPPAACSKAASRSGHLRPVQTPGVAHLFAQLCAVRPEWGLGAQPAPPFREPGQHRRWAAPPRPAATQQPGHVTRWVQDSDPWVQAAVSPTPAAELPHYAGSVTSSIHSRHGLSVACQLRKLNKCI